jgi:hypothetical protein
MDVTRDEAMKKLRVMLQVATFHNFIFLEQAVRDLMV